MRQALEANLASLVVAVAMKTPHRFLRSNEIPLPLSGTLDIPLQLTFALQVTPLCVDEGLTVSFSVPTLPEEGRKHSANQGTEEEEVQKYAHRRVQDSCHGHSRDVSGVKCEMEDV